MVSLARRWCSPGSLHRYLTPASNTSRPLSSPPPEKARPRPAAGLAPGLISVCRADTATIAGIIHLQVLGQLGDGRLGLDPQLIPAALDTQWQGVVSAAM